MNIKSKFGQFYTTNNEYILEGFSIPQDAKIIEPFVGSGELVKWSGRNDIESYDIDPKIETTIKDTLLDPPEYLDKFVLTNPPYLARNKNNNKKIYDLYDVDDLYKAFMKTIIDGKCAGGILIVPLNFISSEDNKVRDLFFHEYHITDMRIFEEKVFEDTDYTVCSFQFSKGKQETPFRATILPYNKTLDILLEEKYGWRVAGEIYRRHSPKYKIGRLLKGQNASTTLFLHAIDTGTAEGKIKLIPNHSIYEGISTDRAFATITTNYNIKNEEEVANRFNQKINSWRDKYHSLFLTNYRNSSKSYARKRISFDLCYSILDQIFSEIESDINLGQ
jgi:hypothetical protein